tara:strand:+ start:3448 stop:3972 length:525 start_codon:yes stop_codon:yes gene_type:complete
MCKVESCEREIADPNKFHFWKFDYCSLYCQRFDELNLKKYKPSKNKHTNHFEHYPPIIESCELCGADVELRWNHELCNRAFCSQKCNNTKHKRKRARKHYFPLKVLKHHDQPLLASEIVKRCEQQSMPMNSASFGMMARSYLKKNIVERIGEIGTYRYSLTPWAKTQPIKSLII